MPDKQPDISTWSAAELMRYATGRMSAAEMYALEKAALDDPFLAEALDGYMEAVENQPVAIVEGQLNRVKPTVTPTKKEAKVVPLWQHRNLRVAVAALFIAGAGWAVFSLLQKPAPVPAVAQQPTIQQPQTVRDTNEPAAKMETAPQPSFATTDRVEKNKEIITQEKPKPATVPASSTAALEQQNEMKDVNVAAAPYSLQQAPGRQMDSSTLPAADVASANTMAVVKQERNDEKMAMRKMQPPDYILKARITDSKNNPVPYANVMVEGQDFGTYSDVSGRFNFISEDSVLRIRVRSIGYANQAFSINKNLPENRILLQEDQQMNNSLPLTVQKKSTENVFRKKTIIERDSIAGQEVSRLNAPYYDQYLLNNNRISPQLNLNRQVQLSFDVSKTGEATNITVVQSSGKVLDQEAIRLLKEGPKLQADTTANGKKKVTIRF